MLWGRTDKIVKHWTSEKLGGQDLALTFILFMKTETSENSRKNGIK